MLYERLGGAAAVDAIVRDFYERVLSDPDLPVPIDADVLARLRGADVQVLTLLLGGPAAGLLPADGDVLRHLRDALWVRGVPHSLVDEVLLAVSRAPGTMAT